MIKKTISVYCNINQVRMQEVGGTIFKFVTIERVGMDIGGSPLNGENFFMFFSKSY
jgi:hypothetical protein